MSDSPTEETAKSAPESDAPAAKKATRTRATKTAAKKTAAKKTVAKKAAKRAVAKKAAAKPTEADSSSTVREEPAELPTAPQKAEAPQKKAEAPRETPTVETPSPAPAETSDPPESQSPANDDAESQEQPKHGRVAGGGPVRKRRERRRKGRHRDRDRQRDDRQPDQGEDRRPVQLEGPKVEVDGMLELAPKGFGFLRTMDKDFEQARDDVFVSPDFVRRYGLRVGVWIKGLAQQGPRGPQLVEIASVNNLPPDEARKLPAFEELKAVNPNKRLSFETDPNRFTTRVIDLATPIGRGQRGLIVSPPRSGKTTVLLHLAEAVRERYEETLHLIVLLVDERPEEVTEFKRCLPGAEIFASSNDAGARNHCRIAELCIERAKRLVEAGEHVFLLMDSITRLARAYNTTMRGGGGRGTGTGGITVGALEVPRRLFAAARNTREAGSLTIIATALVQTNSRADDAIFQEFKGTGNMELVLDRKIAEQYLYPAVDIFKSGTRREELLLPDHMLQKVHLIRRGLSGHRPTEAMERLLYFLKKFSSNPQMLLEIKG